MGTLHGRPSISLIQVCSPMCYLWKRRHEKFNQIISEKQYEASSNSNQTNETEVRTCGVQYCGIQWCDGYGMLIILLAFIYVALLYYQVKRFFGKQIEDGFLPTQKRIYHIVSLRWVDLSALWGERWTFRILCHTLAKACK